MVLCVYNIWMMDFIISLVHMHTLLILSRIVNSQSKNNSPKMEIYCIMRNLILALWFYNNRVCTYNIMWGWRGRQFQAKMSWLNSRW